MQKKPVIPIQSSKQVIGLKCGDCLHFKRSPYYEKVCSHTSLGVKHYANAPAHCFSPDVFQLVEATDPDTLYRLGLFIRGFGAKEARIFMALLKKLTAMEKGYGLKFGQPVYLCFGQSYLSNYFRGFVVSTGAPGDDQVYVTSDLAKKQRKKPFMATLPRSSVFTIKEFKKVKERLIKDGRLQDPNPLFAMPKVVVDSDYKIPSMEDAPAGWHDKMDTPQRKKGSGKKIKMPSSIRKEVTGELTFKVGSR